MCELKEFSEELPACGSSCVTTFPQQFTPLPCFPQRIFVILLRKLKIFYLIKPGANTFPSMFPNISPHWPHFFREIFTFVFSLYGTGVPQTFDCGNVVGATTHHHTKALCHLKFPDQGPVLGIQHQRNSVRISYQLTGHLTSSERERERTKHISYILCSDVFCMSVFYHRKVCTVL